MQFECEALHMKRREATGAGILGGAEGLIIFEGGDSCSVDFAILSSGFCNDIHSPIAASGVFHRVMQTSRWFSVGRSVGDIAPLPHSSVAEFMSIALIVGANARI